MAHFSSLPVIRARVQGKCATALVDSGCSSSIVRSLYSKHADGNKYITAFDGRSVMSRGEQMLEIEIGNIK